MKKYALFMVLLMGLLSLPTTKAADVQRVTLMIENVSFNSHKYPHHHLLITSGESEETLFIPGKTKTVTKRISLKSEAFLKVLFGTVSDYPFVIAGFGSVSAENRQKISKILIQLVENTESSGCPIRLTVPLFLDEDNSQIN